MNWKAARPGQREAVRVIIERVIRGEPYTAIVAPTRYGKTDIIRLATWQLWMDGRLSAAVLLSPNEVLRDQANKDDKWTAFLGRYELDPAGFKKRVLLNVSPDFTRNGEIFISTTTQLVNRNVDAFCLWVESMIHKTGKAPLFYIDECHTGSEDNSWGRTVQELVKAGAQAVLLTATALRSDGHRIPGFGFDVLSQDDVKVYKTRPGSAPELIRVELYQGQKSLLRLIPHHETTFREAWAETPSPLCKVGRVPFDVDLTMISGAGQGGEWLSVLSETEARKALGRIVRTTHVIREGTERLVTNLRLFRQAHHDAAAIVFCGNDNDKDDPAINQHATAIRREIERRAPEFTVVIATSVDNGKDKITAFGEGAGDVLIVKQMASLGLDVGRLKVGLDLSPLRQPAAYIQRLMRIATPHEGMRHCVYISPDDILGRALFEKLISDSNGAATAVDLELIKAWEKERKDGPLDVIYGVNGTADADFEDSHANRAGAAQLPVAEALLAAFPDLIEKHSHAEIVRKAGRFNITPSDGLPPMKVVDTGVEMDALRDDINDVAGTITKLRLGGKTYNQEEYREVIRDVFLRVYRTVGLQPGMRLKDINDVGDLRIIYHEMARVLEDVQPRIQV